MPAEHDHIRIDRLLSPDEAASFLGLTPRAVRDRINRGQLPVVKVGRLNRIRESDLQAYIASRPPRNEVLCEDGEPNHGESPTEATR